MVGIIGGNKFLSQIIVGLAPEQTNNRGSERNGTSQGKFRC